MIVLRNSTPLLISYPRVDVGVPFLRPPTSASVRSSTASSAWPDETTGWLPAVVDNLNQSVASTSDEGAVDLYLVDATAVVVGRTYLLVDVDASFVVTVEAKDGNRIFLGEPLRRAVSEDARLVGWAVSASLTLTQTSAVGSAIVQWQAVIGGVSVSWTETLRIARRLPVIPLTSSELVRAYPEVKSLHARQDDTLEQLISAAWEHVLLPRILRRGFYPEDIVNPDVLRPLLAIACMLHVSRQSRQVDAAYGQRWQDEFERLFDNTIASIDWHVEPQTSPTIPLVPSVTERAQRFTRLVR